MLNLGRFSKILLGENIFVYFQFGGVIISLVLLL